MEAATTPRTRTPHEYHPLEVIPYFQKFRPGVARNLAFTFIWNCAIGLMFWTVAALVSPRSNANPEMLGWNLMMANAIGYSIHGLFLLGTSSGLERRAHSGSRLLMTIYYTVISVVGVLIGWMLVSYAVHWPLHRWVTSPRMITVVVLCSLVISALLSAIFIAREKNARAEAALERERANGERIQREAARAELRALQAQIEPHFLFNTLANVASLIDSNPPLAKRTVESFNRFLRGSLAATRGETTTLGAEATLIAAYLDVLQVRMGPRLRYAVEVPPHLDAVPIAPMLLQPVVENAIKHGLEPKIDGGEIRVAAREEAGLVVVEVVDTGVGFAATTGGGVGLANIRGRLRLL